jgi:glycine cleavage system H protein
MPRYYSQEHVWIDTTDPQAARVGITEHAQEALGDVVFADLPEPGAALTQGQVAGVIESVKAAADLFAPASGTVLATNPAVRDDPSLLNSDPLGEGWLFTLTLSDAQELQQLMDEAAYQAFCG